MGWARGALMRRVDQMTQVDENQTQDKQALLNDGIEAAIERYARDYPKHGEHIAAGVTNQVRYNLPAAFDVDFSQIVLVEKPYYTDSETDKRSVPLDQTQWRRYDNDFTNIQIDFLESAPTETVNFRVMYTLPRTLDDVPNVHKQAFAWLCASIVCNSVAANLANEQQSSFSSDTVDNRQTAETWRNLAKDFRNKYEDVVLPKKNEDVAAHEEIVAVESLLAQRTKRVWHRD
jgi:hypothetical protein